MITGQPYTDETQGSLLVRLSDDAFPTETLTPKAQLVLAGSRHTLALAGPPLMRGGTVVLTFPLDGIPVVATPANTPVTKSINLPPYVYQRSILTDDYSSE